MNTSDMKLFKPEENKANRASLPYRDAVHPGNKSEDVRHNEECRFFLHNNNLQSRGQNPQSFKISISLLQRDSSLQLLTTRSSKNVQGGQERWLRG